MPLMSCSAHTGPSLIRARRACPIPDGHNLSGNPIWYRLLPSSRGCNSSRGYYLSVTNAIALKKAARAEGLCCMSTQCQRPCHRTQQPSPCGRRPAAVRPKEATPATTKPADFLALLVDFEAEIATWALSCLLFVQVDGVVCATPIFRSRKNYRKRGITGKFCSAGCGVSEQAPRRAPGGPRQHPRPGAHRKAAR